MVDGCIIDRQPLPIDPLYMRLFNQAALITGGAQGIGRVIALTLAQEGARVVVVDINPDGAAEVAQEVSGLAIACDVTDETQVEAAVQRTVKEFGQLDILVNCAANIDPAMKVVDMPLEVWERTIAVDLTGTFLCCKHALKAMIPRKRGRIINLSSVAGKMAYPLRASYATAKMGIISLTMTLALEYGEHGITVNAICPAPVEGERMRTVIAQRAVAQGRTFEEVDREYRETTALNTFIQPEDIAQLIVFLASPAGDRITGQAIDVDAGYLLK
jgi:NAD(P)-dependent dehydrogenase (short-subunit alcohol dehydrogenase family)